MLITFCISLISTDINICFMVGKEFCIYFFFLMTIIMWGWGKQK